MITAGNSRPRAVLGVVITLAVALSSVSANAATKHKHKAKPKPKPVCDLVTDPAGDAPGATAGSGAGVSNPSLDIVSADVASNSTTVTVAIRVAKLTPSDSMDPIGREWTFQFAGTSTHTGQLIYARETSNGMDWDGGAGTGVLDFKHNEVRISVPLSHWSSPPLVPGPPFTGFVVGTDWANPTGDATVPTTARSMGDDAQNGKANYVPGTPSCVPVGK